MEGDLTSDPMQRLEAIGMWEPDPIPFATVVRRYPVVSSPGENALWIAVLEGTLLLLDKYEGREDLGKRATRLREEARAWIFSEEEHITTFVWVCGVLGLEPAAVRESLAERYKWQLTKL